MMTHYSTIGWMPVLSMKFLACTLLHGTPGPQLRIVGWHMESDPCEHSLGSKGGLYPEYAECINTCETIKQDTGSMRVGRGNLLCPSGQFNKEQATAQLCQV